MQWVQAEGNPSLEESLEGGGFLRGRLSSQQLSLWRLFADCTWGVHWRGRGSVQVLDGEQPGVGIHSWEGEERAPPRQLCGATSADSFYAALKKVSLGKQVCRRLGEEAFWEEGVYGALGSRNWEHMGRS